MLNPIKVLAALVLSGLLFSCSPYGRVLKRNPLTTSDSANLAARCLLTYPVRERVVSTSDTVSIIDFARAHKAENELLLALYELGECRDSKGAAINLDSLRKSFIGTFKPDTVKIVRKAETVYQTDSAYSKVLELQAREINRLLGVANVIIESQKKDIVSIRKSRNKFRTIVIFSGLVFLAFSFFKIRKFIL